MSKIISEALDELNKIEEELLYEMASVSKEDTGLPYKLWLDSAGTNRNTKHNEIRIKVEVDGDRIPVIVDKENPYISKSVGKTIPNFKEIQEYIVKYYDVFVKHWNGELTDRQALNMLNKM